MAPEPTSRPTQIAAPSAVGPRRPLRVVFVITRSDDLGGAQVHVRDLSSALSRLGHEPLVLAGANGVLAEQLRDRGVPFHSVKHLVRPIRPMSDLLAVVELRRKLRELRPDIVSVHSTKAGVLGRIASRTLGLTTVFTAHGWYFTEGCPPLQKFVYRIIERLAAPLATRIITVSRWDRELGISSGVADPETTVAINNAMPDVLAELRAAPGNSPPRLIMVARFGRQKDHGTLLTALATLTSLEWHVDLVGDGPLRQAMERRAATLGLGNRVSFLGFRTDVPELLARSQLFLLITNWEGFPRSVLEAMRAGLPTIVSDAGGVEEAVVDGHNGFVIPRGDADVLADRLATLIGDSGLRVRLGGASRERYERHFTIDRLVRQTLDVYEELADHRSSFPKRERGQP